MVAIHVVVMCLILSCTGAAAKDRRFLLDDPSDMATLIGYQNHNVHDMSSLVNEASAHAHATGGGSAAGTPYNVPNFPAMGQNQMQAQTGNQGSLSSGTGSGSGSGAATSGSASFPGTNQWRCDSQVVATCDTQCLDVDPKDGCPFCVPSCTAALALTGNGGAGSGTGGTGTSNTGSGQSGIGTSTQLASGGQPGNLPQFPGSPTVSSSSSSGSNQQIGQSGSTYQQPGLSGTGGQGSQSGTLSQQPGTLSGTSGQGSQSGSLPQLPSGLSGTGTQGGSSGSQGQVMATTTPLSCPYYPPNCPKIYTKLEGGCLVCTILRQIPLANGGIGTTAATTHAPTTPPPATCPPKRCVAPCNKGIVLDASGCPRCLCPSHV